MIDFLMEVPIPIRSAPSEFPNRPGLSTVWRYTLKGIRGKLLESAMIGGRRYTSREAIQRFLAAGDFTPPHAAMSTSQRRRQSEAANRALEDRGL